VAEDHHQRNSGGDDGDHDVVSQKNCRGSKDGLEEGGSVRAPEGEHDIRESVQHRNHIKGVRNRRWNG
jgi:hypothetical protein